MTAVQKARRREAHKLENVPVTLATSIVVFVFVDFYLSICICVFVLVYFAFVFVCTSGFVRRREDMRLENVPVTPTFSIFHQKF